MPTPPTAPLGPAPVPASVSIVVVSKSEAGLPATLERLERQVAAVPPGRLDEAEIVVVDASPSGTEAVEAAHPGVRFVLFRAPAGVRVSIPHQRNRGVEAARGSIVAFTDCGCDPEDGWLEALLGPILDQGERMTAGKTGATGRRDPYGQLRARLAGETYLREAPTINLAFERGVAEEVGGFDESFEYGSDIDFTWRAVSRGIRIRYVPEAVVRHDWGSRRRQLERSFAYGKARARLYRKHVLGHGPQSIRKDRLDEADAVPLLYPLYLLGLPLALRHRSYLLLLLLPLWRSRRDRPVAAVVDHLVLGAGVLAGAAGLAVDRRR